MHHPSCPFLDQDLVECNIPQLNLKPLNLSYVETRRKKTWRCIGLVGQWGATLCCVGGYTFHSDQLFPALLHHKKPRSLLIHDSIRPVSVVKRPFCSGVNRDSTAKRSFSPRRHREHGDWESIIIYKHRFNALCVLRELCLSGKALLPEESLRITQARATVNRKRGILR